MLSNGRADDLVWHCLPFQIRRAGRLPDRRPNMWRSCQIGRGLMLGSFCGLAVARGPTFGAVVKLGVVLFQASRPLGWAPRRSRRPFEVKREANEVGGERIFCHPHPRHPYIQSPQKILMLSTFGASHIDSVFVYHIAVMFSMLKINSRHSIVLLLYIEWTSIGCHM